MMHNFVFPQYTAPERIADLCIHAIGVTASVIALAALIFIGVESKTALWIWRSSFMGWHSSPPSASPPVITSPCGPS